MPSENRERYLKMRAIRVPNATKAIGLLAAFSRRRDYEVSREELREIINEIEHEVQVLKDTYGIVDETPAPSFTPSEERNIERLPVLPGDRADIRDAVRRIQDGDVRGGVKDLRKVILGWKVPDDV